MIIFKQVLSMRILLYCNQHNLLDIQCSGSCNHRVDSDTIYSMMQPLKIPLRESLGRQQFTDIAVAWVALPSLTFWQRSRWPRWHCEQKIRGKIFLINIAVFIYYIYIYITFYIIKVEQLIYRTKIVQSCLLQ